MSIDSNTKVAILRDINSAVEHLSAGIMRLNVNGLQQDDLTQELTDARNSLSKILTRAFSNPTVTG